MQKDLSDYLQFLEHNYFKITSGEEKTLQRKVVFSFFWEEKGQFK